jgi:hypothetical protein
MSNEFDDLDELMDLDDDADFDLDEDEDELGLDEEAEFGAEDEDDFGDEDEDDFGDEGEDDFGADDDDMEDMKATSDDPEDPEDDSGPDINGEPSFGGIFSRRGRYTRQQRIYRNRYKRAVKRADWRRGGAGVRRRLRNTWRRLQRLWGKLNDKRRVGLKSPGQTRKAVVKLYGPLPGSGGREQGEGMPVRPTSLIAAGLYRPPGSDSGSGPVFARPAGSAVPPLSAFQSGEVQRQAEATNYAQRFSAPPTRAAQYTPGFTSPGISTPGVSAADSSVLAQLDTMTNERLWNIASGNGMGVFSMPPARMRARQILRSRGVDPSVTNPAALRSAGPGPAGMPGAARPIENMTTDRLMRIASGQAPGALATPAARMRSRQELRSRGVDTAATNPASRRYEAPGSTPLVRPPVPLSQAASIPSVPFAARRPMAPSGAATPAVPAAVQAAIRPAMPRGPIGMRAAVRPTGASGFSVAARIMPGVRPGASANMGFDTYGIDAGAVAPIVADGYSVVPDFSTLGMSAIKEHPIKSVASIAGLFAAGVLLAKPVGDLIRSRVG